MIQDKMKFYRRANQTLEKPDPTIRRMRVPLAVSWLYWFTPHTIIHLSQVIGDVWGQRYGGNLM